MAASMRYPDSTPAKSMELRFSTLFETTSLLPSFNLLLIMITYGGLLSFVALYGRELGIHNPSAFFLIYASGIIGARFTSGKFFDRHGPKDNSSYLPFITYCRISGSCPDSKSYRFFWSSRYSRIWQWGSLSDIPSHDKQYGSQEPTWSSQFHVYTYLLILEWGLG